MHLNRLLGEDDFTSPLQVKEEDNFEKCSGRTQDNDHFDHIMATCGKMCLIRILVDDDFTSLFR